MINRGGEKIASEEVEDLVYRLPEISQVAAVAMPDPTLGERVCVYVGPQPGRTVTLDRIRDSMDAAGVARFKLPEEARARRQTAHHQGRQDRQEGAARRSAARLAPTTDGRTT